MIDLRVEDNIYIGKGKENGGWGDLVCQVGKLTSEA